MIALRLTEKQGQKGATKIFTLSGHVLKYFVLVVLAATAGGGNRNGLEHCAAVLTTGGA